MKILENLVKIHNENFEKTVKAELPLWHYNPGRIFARVFCNTAE